MRFKGLALNLLVVLDWADRATAPTAAVGDTTCFKTASAWLRLVPKQRSSGA